MPLWKVYHPAGAYTAEDKKMLSEGVTGLYAGVPIPKFYMVFVFEEITKDSALWAANRMTSLSGSRSIILRGRYLAP
jgi:hypothetical protein